MPTPDSQILLLLLVVSPYHHLRETQVSTAPPCTHHQQRLRSIYTAFKIALLSQIVDGQLFEQRQLQRLFKSYLDHNSIADISVVRMVIADLKVELNM